MKVVNLTETEEDDFFEGDDGAFYTPVIGVEARCRWCRRWATSVGLYHREVLFTPHSTLVCGRHVRRGDLWKGVVG
jgi:hypothetical protein